MGMFSKLFGNKLEKALLSAARKGDLAEIRSLLDNNPELDLAQAMTSIFGNTALHLAAENGHTHLVEFLLDKGADVNATERELGFTPLHRAATNGLMEVAELLISKGASVDARNKNGATPLHEAVMWGRMGMVELLIAEGADIDVRNSDGYSLLDILIRAAPEREKGLRPPRLHDPYIRGGVGEHKYRKEIAELLIAKGAQVNATTKEGITPLHLTALKGQGELAEVLLARGADVHAKDNDGNTPLHGAAFKGQTDVAELLLSKGANVNAKNNYGATPLGLAKDHAPTKDVVELLEKHDGTK